jgi:hypothetical protein
MRKRGRYPERDAPGLNRTEAEADHVRSGQKDKLLRTNFG